MRAFEISGNGKKLCVAGVNNGVLSAIMHSVCGVRDEIKLTVGGLTTPKHTHLSWIARSLDVGDEIQLKIVDADRVNKPRRKYHVDPIRENRYQKRYVRQMAKQFGWSLVPSVKRRPSPTKKRVSG